MLLTDMIAFHARVEPQRPAMMRPNHVVGYGQLHQSILSAAARLAAEGIRPGDVVALLESNTIEHFVLSLALGHIGAVSAALHDAGQTAIIPGVSAVLCSKAETVAPGLRQIQPEPDWFTGAPIRTPAVHFPPDAVQRVVLSSGTTGTPKPVGLTGSALGARIPAYLVATGGQWQRLMALLGPGTGWGYCLGLTALWWGRTLCAPGSRQQILPVMAMFGVDHLVCSVQQLRKQLDNQDRAFIPLDSLKGLTVGGSIAPRAMLHEATTKLCRRVSFQYGSTETGVVAFAPLEKLGPEDGATGFVAPWARAQVVDEAGAVLPAGVEGLVRLTAAGVGRWQGDDATTADGTRWFHPGDRGVIGADGQIVITGRASSVINVGGVKMAPENIEHVLLRFPGVGDVAVTGATGPDGTETVGVAVVVSGMLDEAAMRAHVATRLKGVRIGPVRRVAEIPRNVSGKIVRREVARLFGS